jgi:hypothetical protein
MDKNAIFISASESDSNGVIELYATTIPDYNIEQ